MSHVEKIKELANRAKTLVEHLETEEATKMALVVPFIEALGYACWNPTEVVPEFTADVGTKKGEKVDYAIKRGGEVAILVEVKKYGSTLKVEHSSQLYRYFSVADARIAILTDGVVYKFFTDLDSPNRMDLMPFLEIDLRDIREADLQRLRRVTKDGWDLDTMLSTATDLKYTTAIRDVLEKQLADPDEDLVRFFYSKTVPGGRFIQSVREQFTPLVSQALTQLVHDRVGARLRSAIEHEDVVSGRTGDGTEPSSNQDEVEELDESGIITTEEELEGFRVVQAIVCQLVDLDRVVHRDTKSYFGILLDNNNRKPIARLHFDRSQKYVGLFDDSKKETRHPIDGPKDLYRFSDELRAGVARWLD